MKTLFLNCLYWPDELGGAERAVRLIAEAHAAAGGDSVVLALSPQGKTDRFVHNGVIVRTIPLFNIGFLHGKSPLPSWKRKIWHLFDAYNPVMGYRIKKILAEEKPDVVESNNLQGFSVAAYRACAALDIPVVQVLHDYYLGCSNSSRYKGGQVCAVQCGQCRVLGGPRRILSRLPQRVISVSRRTFSLLHDTGVFPDIDTPVLRPTGLDLNEFEGARKAPRQTGSPLVIGFLGRLTPIKGLHLLLEAAARFPAERVRVLVGGNGDTDYVEPLKAQYKSYANIEFCGRVAPADFFQKIDVLFAPSLWEEPSGRVITEAYACGVPVAVSRMGGMPEAVEAGKTGFIFDPDPDAIALVIQRMLDHNLPDDTQIAACLEAAKYYGIDTVYRTHRETWESAISAMRKAS